MCCNGDVTGTDFSASLGAFLAGLDTEPDARVSEAVARSHRDTLVPAGLALSDDSDRGEGLVVYDLAEWPTGVRIEFEGILQERNVEHVWHGSDLMVPDRLEFTLDELIDELAGAREGGPLSPGDADSGLARFDLADWEPEQRILLDLRLAGSWSTFEEAWAVGVLALSPPFGVLSSVSFPHSWEESTLVVLARDADQVEGFIGAFESAVLLALDPDAPKVAYDLSGFPDSQLGSTLDWLVEEKIPHELTGEDELVVHEADEAAVERIFDSISSPDEIPAQDEAGLDDPSDGLIVQDVLSELFVAADRLRHDGRNPGAVLDLVEAADRLDRLPLPFGFAPEEWSALGSQVDDLAGLLESGEFTPEDVEARADRLRDRLHPLV